tara:strand:- start:207 stop:401 length:195 start_codon:yes stop_codon:yes gene_type:complete
MIDWESIAKSNGLSPEEFTREILTIAACVGTMGIDQQGDDITVLKFTCSDEIGKIEVTVKRLEQ